MKQGEPNETTGSKIEDLRLQREEYRRASRVGREEIVRALARGDYITDAAGNVIGVFFRLSHFGLRRFDAGGDEQ